MAGYCHDKTVWTIESSPNAVIATIHRPIEDSTCEGASVQVSSVSWNQVLERLCPTADEPEGFCVIEGPREVVGRMAVDSVDGRQARMRRFGGRAY